MTETNFNLAVIPGDGIGIEVVAEGLKVLDVVSAKYGLTFSKTSYDPDQKVVHLQSVLSMIKTLALQNSRHSAKRVPRIRLRLLVANFAR